MTAERIKELRDRIALERTIPSVLLDTLSALQETWKELGSLRLAAGELASAVYNYEAFGLPIRTLYAPQTKLVSLLPKDFDLRGTKTSV